MLSVVDYGATGNGVTDDTAAIQATANAAGVGGSWHVPAGTYLVSASVSVLSGQTITGVGSTSLLVRANAFDRPILLGTSVDDVTISDLAFDGNRIGAAASHWVGVVQNTGGSRWLLARIRVTNVNANYPGVLIIDGAHDNTVRDSYFSTSGYGVVVAVTKDSLLTADRNLITGNTFENIDLNGVFLTASYPNSFTTTAHMYDNVVSNNTLTACGDCYIESGYGPVRSTITGNTITGTVPVPGNCGVLIDDNVNSVVSNNIISGIGTGHPGVAGVGGVVLLTRFNRNSGIAINHNTVSGCENDLSVQAADGTTVTGGTYYKVNLDGSVINFPTGVVPTESDYASAGWFTGTGGTTKLAGNGNRDVYTYGATILTAAGIAYAAKRAAFATSPPATGLDY